MARALALFTLAAMLTVALAWAGDESLPDPTLPPATVMQSATSPDGAVLAAPELQSVILRHNGKPGAVISGQVVELGGHYGEAKLIKVSEDEVVLTGVGGRQVLKLAPAVNKTAANNIVVGKKIADTHRKRNGVKK